MASKVNPVVKKRAYPPPVLFLWELVLGITRIIPHCPKCCKKFQACSTSVKKA
jgi:hypothetical protein